MKNSILSNIIIFAVGAAVGSAVTWKFVEEKYKRIADEEIESVKEVFASRRKSVISEEVKEEKPEEPVVEYKKIAEKYTEKKELDDSVLEKPFVIDPDDFDMYEDYDEISLIYYADGILCDEDDDPVVDVENKIGWENLNAFGEYGEDDAVYIRNDELQTDYEILRSEKLYSEIKEDK